MRIQESGEMYLEAIYVLSQKQNSVHAIDISQHLGYSKPSVSRAMGILKTGGYITVDEENHIHLTDNGRAVAEKIYERHDILSKMLISLGVPKETAIEDACRLEHAISDESFAAIKNHFAIMGK
ncbi:MAG: metal-dependent transcriptional regulator [Ruminococcaceae bacterium]|nr:metal-dependent transcriptional regulator [Oscillospiraceae bacterium]